MMHHLEITQIWKIPLFQTPYLINFCMVDYNCLKHWSIDEHKMLNVGEIIESEAEVNQILKAHMWKAFEYQCQ